MVRILGAFAWMRWRVLVNSLERTSGRDTLERLSLAVEQLGPLIAAVVFIPSALGLAVLAGSAGYGLATGTAPPLTFSILRYLLLAVSALCVVGPIVIPVSERVNAVRLLLLPIPRRVLYLAQASGAVSDPWILLAFPIVLALPLGLAAGGAIAAALLVLVAGVLLILALVGLSSVSTTVLHLVVRDRRRGELITLLFILALPAIWLLPGLFDAERRQEDRPSGTRARREAVVPAWMREAGGRVFSVTPSELFTDATRSAVDHRVIRATAPLGALVATSFVLHGIGLLAFGRLLDAPASSGPRRATGSAATWGVKLPALSPGASAVALTQLRLALRTPRGRSILLSPLLVFGMFAIVLQRSGGMEFGFIALHSGMALATFGSGICLLSILPFAMNQFAVDRAGLTLVLLSPLRNPELLAGKAVGNGLIAFGPALLTILIAFVLFPGGSLALWASIPLGLASTYLLTAPAAAALSAAFPRAVDLNSIGSGSNAHAAAGLLGMLLFAAAGAPAVLIVWVTSSLLARPDLTLLVLLLWCLLALALCRLLFIPVQLLFDRRRENLGLVVR